MFCYINLAVDKQFALRRSEAFLIFTIAVCKTRVHSPKIYPDTSKQPKSHTAAFSWFPCRQSRDGSRRQQLGMLHWALGTVVSSVFMYAIVRSSQLVQSQR